MKFCRMLYCCVALAVFFLSALSPSAAFAAATPAWNIEALEAAKGRERLVVVEGEGTSITLHAFEKKSGVWSEVFSAQGFSGRSGIAEKKREGDGATPAGVFAMNRAFGIKSNPGSKLPYTKVDAGDYWVDDPASQHYNTWVRVPESKKDWKSAEHLISEKGAYEYAIVIEYNTDPIVKGAGSAIFLHCSKGRPTAGCVSVPEADMLRLLRFIQPGDVIVIARTLPR